MRRVITSLGKLFFIGRKRTFNAESEIKNILFIRSGSIGDVLMTTPLLHAVHKKYPHAAIDYLVGEYSKQIVEGNPAISTIISFDESLVFSSNFRKIIGLIKRVRQKKYDVAIVCDKSWLWGVFAFLCGVNFRIGFNRAGEGFSLNQSVPFDGSAYELEYNNKLGSLIGIGVPESNMKLYLSDDDKKFADEIVEKNKMSKRFIGIAPGGAKNPGQNMDSKRPPF